MELTPTARIAILVGILLALIIAASVLNPSAMLETPTFWNDELAREHLFDYLAAGGQETRGMEIVGVDLENPLLARDVWAFAVRNRDERRRCYSNLYLVSPLVMSNRYNVTSNYDELFKLAIGALRDKWPFSAEQTVLIARSYAALRFQQPPKRLRILSAGEVPRELESLRPALVPEIAQASATRHYIIRSDPRREDVAYEVEFAAYYPDHHGDIYFWHIELGIAQFSAAVRPIYLAPRVLPEAPR